MDKLRVVMGFLLAAAAIWMGAEVYNKGTDGAFGGVLGDGSEAETQASMPKRAGAAVEAAHAAGEDRRARMMGE